MSEKKATLAEAAELHAAKRRVQAAANYKGLLHRDDPGDAEAIVEVMAILGRPASSLEDDLALVQRIVECKRLAGSVERLQAEVIRKNAAVGQAHREVEEARQELERTIETKVLPLETAWVNAEASLRDAKQAATDLGSLEDEWTAIEQGVDGDLRAVRRKALAAQTPQVGPAVYRPATVHGPNAP